MKFSDQLRTAMGDMTQAELSRLSGVSQPVICRYLGSDRLPGLRHLEALERALPALRQLRLQANGTKPTERLQKSRAVAGA